ncbi:hypothetical protein GCK72_003719 [Caenorhabditis remanei]|uniref:Calpain catalytic domain-containing protein n=1 Tax=Caenorhabditis remanei TaxID=31234 RepID=A0A6A5HAB5_CAERE|nr:hypothetical protein GCK72_003719 [Caenorhabditis remanei]KAF1763774.1 hypothetical protein GCK72_003719 [Caenorhabditis remanei]
MQFLVSKFNPNQTATWARPISYVVKEIKSQHRTTKICTRSKWELWNDTCPYRVYQNGLGNCGLIASLAAISIHKCIIEFLFRDFKINDYGAYQVKLCIDGEWKNIIIDDWIPLTNGSLRGVKSASRLGKNLIWAALIEKAIAKVFNGYKNIYAFCSAAALRMITGAPVTSLQFKDFREKTEKLWEILLISSSKNYPIVCSCLSKGEILRKYGRTAKPFSHKYAHVFTVLSVILYKSHRLLKLRNPWGYNIWTGKWTDETNTKILDSKDTKNRAYGEISGSFWIGFDEFLKYFDSVEICRYRESWSQIRLSMPVGGLWDDSQKGIKIIVPEGCDICVSAIKPNCYKIQYHTWVSIHEINQDDEIGQIIFCEPIYESSEDIHLLPGGYMIYVTNFYSKKERNVVIHSSIPINASLCSWNPQVLVKVYQRIVAEKGEELLKQRDDVSIKKYSGDKFVIMMAENYTDERYLHVQTFCSKIKMCWWSRGDSNNRDYGDVIPPRSRQILIATCHLESATRKGFPMAIDYYLSDEKMTKLGTSNRAAHIPSIRRTDYIHQTVLME